MRSTIKVAVMTLAVAGSALAQPVERATTEDPGQAALPRIDLTPAQNPDPINPAIRPTQGNNPGAPVAGLNSFTEAQAKARIEARGFTNVSELTKDDKGIWRGTAVKDGKSVDVALDYQGNVVPN